MNNDMFGVGVVEGFFGPAWSWNSRHRFCESLPAYGGDFYLYAPKRDNFLRKTWKQTHPEEIWKELQRLSSTCHRSRVAFGVGLSPYEVYAEWNQQAQALLRDKIKRLEELNIQFLGLFFDDMRGAADLADKQVEIVEYVRDITNTTILFCPTYYSDDPLLDRIFGQRPDGYLERIGKLSKDIQIFWTGRKVIPESILADELNEVARVLRRKPFIWDNYFANDGPKQCKFLKLKHLDGRTCNAFRHSNGWAFNLMNQPSLSEIVFASSVETLTGGVNAEGSFHRMAAKLAGDGLELLLRRDKTAFLEMGLDKIDEGKKKDIIQALSSDRFSQELFDWLNGKYVVGAECLTD